LSLSMIREKYIETWPLKIVASSELSAANPSSPIFGHRWSMETGRLWPHLFGNFEPFSNYHRW
jgi:hypothetical protein